MSATLNLAYITEEDEVITVSIKRILYKDMVQFRKCYQDFLNVIVGQHRGYVGSFLADSEENYELLKAVIELIPIKEEPGFLELDKCINDYEFIQDLLISRDNPDDELGRPYIASHNKLDHAGNVKKAIVLLNEKVNSTLENAL